MILYRCFAWNERARPDQPDSPLWFPRVFQGDGRHDNPDVYGCLYLTDREISGVVEQLARFRGQRLIDALLVRRGLASRWRDELRTPPTVDLADPACSGAAARPSGRHARRAITTAQALAFYRDTLPSPAMVDGHIFGPTTPLDGGSPCRHSGDEARHPRSRGARVPGPSPPPH